jgi:AmmeMemoRadiSam system protein B
VILLGVSHHYLFEGAAISDCRYWQTPLGKVEIDRDTVAILLRTSSAFKLNNRVHEPEHGLEVQVPFLQRVRVDFQIVPILLSPESAQDVERVSRELAQIMDDLTLLIVSSDLSHFPRQADADRVDTCTINAILSGDSDRFQEVTTAQLAAGVSALYTCACGAEAIKVGLNITRLRDLNAFRLLAYANSGQVSGDSSRVVGYAAIAGYRSGGDKRV